MKKTLYKMGITLLFSFLGINSGIAQGDHKYDVQKQIKLNNESEMQEIILPVKDSVNSLTILVQSNIQVGDLTLEILDPKGDKHGYFSIGSQLSTPIKNKSKYQGKSGYYSNPDKANGSLSRTINKPQEGDWKIKILPKDATGTIILILHKSLWLLFL